MNSPLSPPDPTQKEAALTRLELSISVFLRWGVIVSGALLAIGWLGQWLKNGDLLSTFQVYSPEPLQMLIRKSWESGDYGMVISIAGLAILVVLPICRVLLTAFLFIKQKDLYLAAMALFVFAVLLGSFFLGVTFE